MLLDGEKGGRKKKKGGFAPHIYLSIEKKGEENGTL